MITPKSQLVRPPVQTTAEIEREVEASLQHAKRTHSATATISIPVRQQPPPRDPERVEPWSTALALLTAGGYGGVTIDRRSGEITVPLT